MTVDLRLLPDVTIGQEADGAATALVFAYLNRAVALLDAGYAAPGDVDTAMRLGCGLPSGPFETLDLLGLDAAHDTLAGLYRDTGDPAFSPAPLLTELVRAGRLGRASGQGFHRYGEHETPADGPVEPGPSRPVDRIGVLGTGTMARGIAEVTATAGIPTVVVGRDAGRAAAAVERISASLSRRVTKGRLSRADHDHAMGLLKTSGDRAAVCEADLVVEAVVEDLPVKRALFAELGRTCRPGAVLATTTSSLPVTGLAMAAGRPRDVLGLHFFNPAPAMRLVEVVRTPATAQDVLGTGRELCARLGKTGVECADRTGFIVNYLLFGYLNRAVALLDTGGVTVAEVDDAVRGAFGYPLGPFALLDVIGLDVSLAILRRLHLAFPEPDFLAAARLEQLVAAGRLGRKAAGGGFHPPG